MNRFGYWRAALKDRLRYSPRLRGLVTRWLTRAPFPRVLGVEPAADCDLACGFCAPAAVRRDAPATAAPRLMAEKTFARLCAELARHGRRTMIILHNSGEPLLHPRLPDMVAELKRRRLAAVVQFSTNGVRLDADLARRLVRAGLDGITLSIDAATGEDYRQLKGRDCLAMVQENASALLRVRRELGSATPFITAKMTGGIFSREREVQFLRAWRQLADRAVITPWMNWGGAIAGTPNYARPARRFACHFLWYYPVLGWDGEVWQCCATADASARVGNLGTASLAEIWQGEPLRRIRARHLAGEFAALPACANCCYWAEGGADLDNWFRRFAGAQAGAAQ